MIWYLCRRGWARRTTFPSTKRCCRRRRRDAVRSAACGLALVDAKSQAEGPNYSPGHTLVWPFDPPAAEHAVTVIEHHGLPRRDGALRLVKLDADAVLQRPNRRRRRRMAIADLRLTAKRSRRRPDQPVDARRNQRRREQVLAVT